MLLELSLLARAKVNSGVAEGYNQDKTRAVPHILETSHEWNTKTTTSQWVDDLAQRTQAPPSEVVDKAVQAALQMVRDLEDPRLAVAFKSVVIATNPDTATKGVAQLGGQDIHFQCALT